MHSRAWDSDTAADCLPELTLAISRYANRTPQVHMLCQEGSLAVCLGGLRVCAARRSTGAQ